MPISSIATSSVQFQFHKVQLKEKPHKWLVLFQSFQFHKVQLKAVQTYYDTEKEAVSIP